MLLKNHELDEADYCRDIFAGLTGARLAVSAALWAMTLILFFVLFFIPGVCVHLQDWWDRKKAEEKHVQNQNEFRAEHCTGCQDLEDCRARSSYVNICMEKGSRTEKYAITIADGICLECGGAWDMLTGCSICNLKGG